MKTNFLSLFSLRVLFAFFAVIAFFSCGNEVKDSSSPQSDSISTADTTAHRTQKTENDFISVCKTIDISNVNQFIHPEKGLWLIQSSGAMPNMMNTTQADKNFPVDFSNCMGEELPKVNCDLKWFWTKDGCLAQEINSFKDEKIWTFCGLSKEDEAKVSELAQTISWTVINTSFHARYYFSQIDGKWYLSFVDLRKPCEA